MIEHAKVEQNQTGPGVLIRGGMNVAETRGDPAIMPRALRERGSGPLDEILSDSGSIFTREIVEPSYLHGLLEPYRLCERETAPEMPPPES